MPTTGTFVDTRDGTVYTTVLMPDGKWWSRINLRWNDPSYTVIEDGRFFYRPSDWAVVAPPGAHIPTSAEFNALFAAVGANAGVKLRTPTGWGLPNSGPLIPGTNDFGFDLLPTGYLQSGAGSYQFDWNRSAHLAYQHGPGVFANYATDSGSLGWYSVAGGSPTGGYRAMRFIVDSGNVPDPGILAFPFEPDWERGVKESVEYMTKILTARTGMEQRYRLRHIPRRKLSFDILPTASEVQALDTFLWAHQGERFGVPWWPDGVPFSGAIAAGATSIAIDTTNRLFSLAPLVMVWQSPSLCEVQTVQSVTGSAVNCSALANSYTNPIVLPVFQGRIESTQEVSRITGRVSEASVKFLCEVGLGDPRPAPPAAPVTAYGFEVLTAEPNWESPSQSVRRILERTDNGYGPVLVEDRGGVSFQSQPFRWFLSNRAESQELRNFFDRCAGRLVPFWAPTWREDLTLANPAAPGDLAITVKRCGYTDRMFPDAARRYLAIMTSTGNSYRKVTSSSQAATTETLSLDSAVGLTLPAGTPISFLVLSRLASDEAELDWSSVAFAEATLQHVEIPKEVV